MENISCSDLEENFDRVQDGERFIIDDKVVLCGADDYDYLNDHYDGC